MAVRKQSGPMVSTVAGRLLSELQDIEANGYVNSHNIILHNMLKTLCASVLSQDETKGQKHAPRKRKTT